MDRRDFLRLVGAAGATAGAGALLVACNANGSGATGSTSTTKAGGTLYILQDSASYTFDPATSESLAITALGLVHRRLTAWSAAPGKVTTVVPDLATDTGRTTDGGKTWKYTLRDNLTMSDGTPITSATIKWGIERSFAPTFASGLGYHKTLLDGGTSYRGPFSGQDLASIETPDDKTIVFHLVRAYGDWPWIVSLPAFSPVPKGKGTDANYYQHPIASGPYQVTSYKSGVSINLARNPHWTKAGDQVRTALPNAIVIEMSLDDSVIAQRLIADSGNDKNAFGASFVDPAQLAQLSGNSPAHSRVVTSQAGAVEYLALNTQRHPLNNVAVRKAFQYAIDRSTFQVASAGTAALAGPIATTLITPGIAGRQVFDLYQAPAAGDPAKAKQLLAAAGFPNGLPKLTMLIDTANNGADKAQAVAESLAKAGIPTTIQPLDDAAWVAKVTADTADYDLTLSSWQPDFPSANANIQPLYASTEIGGGGFNLARYSNPQVDAMIADAQATVDQTQAGQKWAAIDKRIMADSPVVPLIYTRNSFLHGSDVDNFFVADFPAYPNYLKIGISQ
jgi:peptide/nickel transport system substrate-binding protein